MGNAVEFRVEENIAVIELNRPDRKNAINEALLKGLYESIVETAEHKDIKAAIITGRGDCFCSGIDLKALEKGENLFDPLKNQKGMVEIFASCHKPIIGAVNGYAITGGFEIALNCDFLIASSNACFKDTHALVGIHPGWGMTQLLRQAVGLRMAKQISMTCETLSAQKALEIGLVNEVVEPDDLLNRVLEIAKQITSVNQDIMFDMKKLYESQNVMSFENALIKENTGFHDFLNKVFKN